MGWSVCNKAQCDCKLSKEHLNANSNKTLFTLVIWASTQENLSWWFTITKGANQPAQTDQCVMESIIS